MLVYGFVYPDSDDPYSTTDPTQGLLVTDTGAVVSGSALDPVMEEPPAGASLTHDLMGNRLDSLEGRRLRKARELGDIQLPTAVINLSRVGSSEDDPAIIGEFVDAMNRGEGQLAEGGDFLDLLRLDASLGDFDDLTPLEADPAPVVPAAHTPEGYRPRLVGGLKDVDVLRRAHNAQMTVLLSGAPGTGKTALCQATFGDELIAVSCNDGMILPDLVGQWMPVPHKPGEFEWHDGPLLTAMLEGRPFLLEDFSWMSLTLQAALLPVLDHRRCITVGDRPGGQQVEAAEGFSVVITQNPDVGVGITDPIRDRIAFEIEVPSDLTTAERLGADPDLMVIAHRLEEADRSLRQEGGYGWVPSIRTLLDATKVRDVYGAPFAAATFVAACPITEPSFRENLRALLAAQMATTTISDGLVSRA